MTLSLYLQVRIFRLIASLSTYLDLRAPPRAPSPSFEVTIPTASRQKPGTIKLLFYTPAGYQRPSKNNPEPLTELYPLVINFHGGGYTLGDATMNARFASHVTSNLSAVFVSVEYGLAPEHPYPIAIGDCIDAVHWLWTHANEYNLNSSNTIITGFSGGGTLATVTTLRVNAMQAGQNIPFASPKLPNDKPNAADNDDHSKQPLSPAEAPKTASGKVTGLIAFYPGLDWTQTRAERTATNPISGSKGSIPAFLYRIFDRSYLGAGEMATYDMASLDFSPAKIPSDDDGDTFLRTYMPDHLALYSCEWDQLMGENEAFRERMLGLGKTVGGYLEKDVAHAWDTRKAKDGITAERRRAMYNDAVRLMKPMTGKRS